MGGVSAAQTASPVRGGGVAQRIVLGFGIAVLLVFVGYPLCWLALGALGLPHHFGFDGLMRSFTRPANLVPLTNTIILAASAGLGSVAIGVPLAFAVARTDMALRRIVHALAALAYILPPYLTAIAYIILLGPNAGYINRLTVWLTGTSMFNVMSAPGVAFVIIMHVFAYPYFLTSEALRVIDGTLEESARMLGAARGSVLVRITLPLVAPAITGGALLAAVDSLALFGPQAILGLPAQVVYLPTRIYAGMTSYPPRIAEASALSLVLVVLTLAGLALQRRALARRSFVTVAGKGVRATRWPLGAWRWPLGLLLAGVVVMASAAPVGVLAVASVSRVWTDAPWPSNLTLDHFRTAVLDNEIAVRGIANSLRLATAAATLAAFTGLAVAYLDQRTRLRGRRLLDYLAILPLGLPGTVLAVALLQAFIRPPVVLYGTIWILLAAYVARSVPLSARNANAALRQLDVSLEEAARIGGAGWLGAMRLILLPLLRPAMLTGWLLVFIPALGELSATILLYSSGTETISVAIYRLNDLGQLEVVAALAMVLIGLILAAALLLQMLGGRGRIAARAATPVT